MALNLYLMPNLSYLFVKVNGSSLGLFRILFSIFMLKDFMMAYQYFTSSLSQSLFFSTYDGFHWVQLFPSPFLELFFGLMFISCVLLMLGRYYRLNAVLTFFGFTYIFLIDRGHYNNHFYLYCILHFFLIIIDADRWGTIHKQKENVVPYWQILLLRCQVFIVYFYGGLAKISEDWFSGYPMIYWLKMSAQNFEGPVHDFLMSDTSVYFICYTGFLFDLLIGFVLLSSFRRLAILPILIFHLSNHFLWNIGTFPFVMVAATFLFFDPAFPENFVQKIRKKGDNHLVLLITSLIIMITGLYFYEYLIMSIGIILLFIHILRFKYKINLLWLFKKEVQTLLVHKDNSKPLNQKPITAFLSVWFLLQITIPFRHTLFHGDPSWTGEGHFFAWRMMLVASTDAVKYYIEVPETGQRYPVALEKYMNFRQFRKLGRTPKAYHRFAHFLADELKKNGAEKPIVRMEIYKSVNERAPRLLNDTTINYATLPYNELSHSIWFQDWDREMDPLEFREDRFEHWSNVIYKNTPKDVNF